MTRVEIVEEKRVEGRRGREKGRDSGREKGRGKERKGKG